MNGLVRVGRPVCVALTLLLSAACVTRTVQNRIEVGGNATIEQKTAFAKALVTEARFSRLKLQLKARFPNLSQSHLDSNLGLRWDVVTFKPLNGGPTTSTVFVSVIGRIADGFDANAVVAAAVEILTPEVNPPGSSVRRDAPSPDNRLQSTTRRA